MVGANTIYALVSTSEEKVEGQTPDDMSWVFRAERTPGTDTWTWYKWWESDGPDNQYVRGCLGRDLLVLPKSGRILVLGTQDNQIIVCLDADAHSNEFPQGQYPWPYQEEQVWMDYTAVVAENGGNDNCLIGRTIKTPVDLACDQDEEWLYVATGTQTQTNDFVRHCANVVRARIPVEYISGTTQIDWEPILNTGEPGVDFSAGIEYDAVDQIYLPTNMPGDSEEMARSLPSIRKVGVHPDNPTRVFAGLYVSGWGLETFHPNNGLWEYSETNGVGNWSQVVGGSLSEPSKGVKTFEFIPGDSSELVVGTWGQEYFRVSVAGSPGTSVASVSPLEPLHAEQTSLMVSVDPFEAVSSVEEVWFDGRLIGLPYRVALKDDGESPDWAEGDGVWTADFSAYSFPQALPVSWELPVFARDSEWNMFRGHMSVDVIAVPGVFFANGSTESGADHSGLPVGLTAIDAIDTGTHTMDGYRDLFLTVNDDGVGADDLCALLRGGQPEDGVPQFADQMAQHFATVLHRPGVGHGRPARADFNGDGQLDLVLPAGNSSDGLRFYSQDGNGFFHLEESWNPLSSTDEANTWIAACADYNGDGQVDVFLGRYIPADESVPGSTMTALPDVLLRNDIASSGSFVDATVEMELPPTLATVAAEWGGISTGRRPWLLIVDGRPGACLYYFENDLVKTYPNLEPCGPIVLGNQSTEISDMVLVDDDSDGYLEILLSHTGSMDVTRYEFEENIENPATAAPAYTIQGNQEAQTGIRVLDYDLDGDFDHLRLPGDGASPELWRNAPAIPGRYEKVEGVGLEPFRGNASGAIVTSFNDDGAPEIFLGRSQATNAFLAVANGASATSDNWVGIKLLESEQRPVPVLNASVRLSSGPRMFVSGTGSSDHVLYLGCSGPTISGTIEWPSLYSKDIELNVGEVTTVYHRDPGMESEIYIIAYPDVTVKALPDCRVVYTFHWMTPIQTDLGLDSVTIDGTTTVSLGSDNVEVRQWYGLLPANHIPVIHHSLRLKDQPCVAGAHTYTVTSGLYDWSDTSDQCSFTVRVCTSLDPDDPNINQP